MRSPSSLSDLSPEARARIASRTLHLPSTHRVFLRHLLSAEQPSVAVCIPPDGAAYQVTNFVRFTAEGRDAGTLAGRACVTRVRGEDVTIVDPPTLPPDLAGIPGEGWSDAGTLGDLRA